MYICPCCPHEDTDEESLNKHVNSHFLTEDTQHHADAAPAQNPNSPTPAITFTPAMTPSLTAPHLPVHHRDTDMDNTSHPASKRIRVQTQDEPSFKVSIATDNIQSAANAITSAHGKPVARTAATSDGPSVTASLSRASRISDADPTSMSVNLEAHPTSVITRLKPVLELTLVDWSASGSGFRDGTGDKSPLVKSVAYLCHPGVSHMGTGMESKKIIHTSFFL